MNVIDLRLSENARQDTWRLMGADQGKGASEATMCALQEIASRMGAIQTWWSANERQPLIEEAAAVGRDASVLGLNRIARVARVIERLAHEDDHHALGANVARLMRLGKGLFEDIWTLQNQQG